ncbi:MAG: nucleotidyltransferase domain-containing protein [Candidatus Limnocylindria bacterium]
MKPENAAQLIGRFVEATREDRRIAAALVYGSHAAGTADEHSDLDLGLVPAVGFEDALVADARRIVEAIGTPLIVAVFDDPRNLHVTLESGADLELIIHRAEELDTGSSYRVLFDRDGVVEGATWDRVATGAPEVEAADVARRLEVFWHDVGHLGTALARGERWWAYGQLDEVRRLCIGLLRIEAGLAPEDEAYWKLDGDLSAHRLTELEGTVVAPEIGPMRDAAVALLELYRSVGRSLADRYGVPYPDALDRVMTDRLGGSR